MTASRTRPAAAAAASVHEHAWLTESVHATSEGRVRYVRCAGCSARRVDREHPLAVVPVAMSRAIG